MQHDKRAQQLLAWLRQLPGYLPDNFHMISGDASFRRYFRFGHPGKTCIAVDAPPEHENNIAFVNIADAYLAAGVSVPSVLDCDFENGFLLLQDFGDQLFAQKYGAHNVSEYYQAALAHLPKIQEVTATSGGELPEFDQVLLDNEYHLFNHWLLEVHLQLGLSVDELDIIKHSQAAITTVFKDQPQVGVHRDYHSRNLMLLGGRGTPAAQDIGVIDFQDAVIGPITYDAVSLLRDCYVVWPQAFVEKSLHDWYQRYYAQYQWQEFRYWFDMVGLQRHIKASGIFCRLCHRDGKQGYLNDIPRTLQYIVDIGAQYDSTRALASLVAEKIMPAMLAKQPVQN